MTVSVADFDYVRKLVYEHSAIALDESKSYLVEARLAPIVQREGLPSMAELVSSLRAGCPALRDDVVAAVATHETSFFRDLHPFDALREVVIPEILAANGGGSLHLWSAATATGQEAYSLAMLVRDHFPSVRDVSILATDLSDRVLGTALAARYSQLEINRGLPARLLVKHFDREGRDWVVKPDVVELVTFRRLNLASSFQAVPAMDVIFLRNVLIYFDNERKADVLRRMARILRPGGYLFLGGTETTYGLDDSYERVSIGKAMCYRLKQPHGSNGANVQR